MNKFRFHLKTTLQQTINFQVDPPLAKPKEKQ